MQSTAPRSGPRAATPMAFVRAVLHAYAHYGRDPARALRAAQIAPRELRNPAARVTAAQFESLNEIAMQELDDEALAWFGRRLPWGSYGMLCRASLSSPDLGVAIKRWCRHHRLLTDDVTLGLRTAGGLATVTVHEHRPLPPESREFALVSLLRFLHGYASWAIDSRVSLREAQFPFAAPEHADVYALMFCDSVQFGARHAAYSFDERYLRMPLQRDERALRTMLRRALPLTVLQYRRDRLLGQRVRELLRTRPGETGSAHALATLLNMSARTLHRQLQGEGATLQAIKDEVRRERAMQELRRDNRPIKQVALSVGFRNERSFARAFRHWTGSAPGEFRRARAAD